MLHVRGPAISVTFTLWCGQAQDVFVCYCSQECQKKNWMEGGHKAACPQLREKRERRKHVKAERLEPT